LPLSSLQSDFQVDGQNESIFQGFRQQEIAYIGEREKKSMEICCPHSWEHHTAINKSGIGMQTKYLPRSLLY